MSSGRTGKIAAAIIIPAIIVLIGACAIFATSNGLLAGGEYYTKIDNAHLAKNEQGGGVINFQGSEPFVYTLPAYSSSGDELEVRFGASRELRQDAYLKLELEPLRGVVSWEEVDAAELPPKTAEHLVS